jgi:hypothetical protein
LGFAGDASKLVDDSKWTPVRNKKGVRNEKRQGNLKFSSTWKTITKNANLINLAVAPKANDYQTNIKVHETHARNYQFMNKREKSVTKHADIPDMDNSDNFQKMLTGIKETEMQLNNNYNSINGNLTSLETSLKNTANLLLVQKHLHRHLLNSKIERLPKTWNEFWIKPSQTLPRHHEVDFQNQIPQFIDQKLQDIDRIRKLIGDLDLNVFKGNEIKQKVNKHRARVITFNLNSEKCDENYDDFIAHGSDSDTDLICSDKWSYIGFPKVPRLCHHCYFIGHHRTKSPNYKKIKARSVNTR